jgi:hypothetical protein
MHCEIYRARLYVSHAGEPGPSRSAIHLVQHHCAPAGRRVSASGISMRSTRS